MLLLVLLSLILMMGDHRFHCFGKVRASLALIIAPVQYLVTAPIDFTAKVGGYVTTQHRLLVEHRDLKTQLLLLQTKMQRFIALQQENSQLRALLSSSTKLQGKVLVARIMAVSFSPFDQQLLLNKGKKHGVYVGQPVLDADGVMGQVIGVGLLSSRVLLITSARSAVPTQDVRSGVRAIALGSGASNDLKLIHVSDTADIKFGDLLQTSALGLRFPLGYPVGVVNKVQHIAGDRFATVSVTPSAQINRSREVLLVWPSQIQQGKSSS